MRAGTIERLVHGFYAAFFAQDREAAEKLMSPGFTFSSPLDDRIGKAELLERCWPNADQLPSPTPGRPSPGIRARTRTTTS